MGPQPSSRGNLYDLWGGADVIRELQWGRNLPVAEIFQRAQDAFEEERSFNGAATFQSRKFGGWAYA